MWNLHFWSVFSLISGPFSTFWSKRNELAMLKTKTKSCSHRSQLDLDGGNKCQDPSFKFVTELNFAFGYITKMAISKYTSARMCWATKCNFGRIGHGLHVLGSNMSESCHWRSKYPNHIFHNTFTHDLSPNVSANEFVIRHRTTSPRIFLSSMSSKRSESARSITRARKTLPQSSPYRNKQHTRRSKLFNYW